LYIALCDHCSPFYGDVSQEIAELRVVTWCREYARIAGNHVDSSGNHPVHTFFYSETDYNPQFLDALYRISKTGIADVEIMIDHDHDTPLNFRRKLEEFRDVLFHHHGLLRKNHDGQISYGFIHGHWALNNSRPDGKWCGVPQEIPILRETGCYADFTYPSAPDITQPSIINAIYFADTLPGIPATHEPDAIVGKGAWDEKKLLFIQGPLSITGHDRFPLIPSIDRGELSSRAPFHEKRLRVWLSRSPMIRGTHTALFIKLFTCGMIDHNIRYLMGSDGLERLWSSLEHLHTKDVQYRTHYVSAWSMYDKIRQICIDNSSKSYNRQTI
jgi:hypothetical protein